MLSYVIVDYPLLFVRECPILFYFYDNTRAKKNNIYLDIDSEFKVTML